MATIKLGIDMGSTTTTIYRLNCGLVLREPSKVLCEVTAKGNIVKDAGIKAEKLQGRTPNYMAVMAPLQEGVVCDVKLASKMLKIFLQKVTSDNLSANVDVLMNIPCGATLEERRSASIVAYNAGATSVNLIPNVIACAIGTGYDVNGSQNVLVIDIGGGCTDIAVIGMSSIIQGLTLNVGASQMDSAIQEYIEKRFGLIVNISTAQSIKEEIGSLFERDTASVQVTGLDKNTNEMLSINITAGLIYDSISEFYRLLADTINSVISTCSNEVVQNLHNADVIFCGNACKIAGFERFMKERIGFDVALYDGNCLANGLGMILNDKNLLKSIIEKNF